MNWYALIAIVGAALGGLAFGRFVSSPEYLGDEYYMRWVRYAAQKKQQQRQDKRK